MENETNMVVRTLRMARTKTTDTARAIGSGTKHTAKTIGAKARRGYARMSLVAAIPVAKATKKMADAAREHAAHSYDRYRDLVA